MDQYIGRLLDDRYEILEVIGTGGMAVVYKARCHRLNRLVAIKILKDELSKDEEFRRRFHAEGEAVAMLSHPNIVQVYDVSTSGSANYIVMELIDGISLKQYMEKKGVLNWKETLHFAMQIAKGLEHAHSRGIVHRDIKPHNIMVLKNGSVKVMDFGIARVMNKSNTLTKEALGSVHYISPEQAKGGQTDSRSDLYSLGVVMYEMMTGRPPYDGESAVAVAIQHINGGAPRPSTLNPNIPRGLEQIIVKAMALDLRDRYASATEMLQDMEEFRKNPNIVFQHHFLTDDATQIVRTDALPASIVSLPTTAERKVRARTGEKPEKPAALRRHSGGQPKKKKEEKPAAPVSKKDTEERRSRVATTAVVVCSAVAVIAIVVFLVALFNGALLNQEQDLVEVPYLQGRTYSDTLETHYSSDFNIRLNPQQYSDTYAEGQIISQQPSGGTKVQRGTDLWITVSMGTEPPSAEMEDLTDTDEATAIEWLEEQGYVPLKKYEASSIYAAGQVIRTDPSDGETVTQGQTVYVYVSSGPAIVAQTMPDVVGLDLARAKELMDSLGFTNVRYEVTESQKPIDEVVYQSVTKNTSVNVESEIIIQYSGGLENQEVTETTAETVDPQATEATQAQQVFTVSFTVPERNVEYRLEVCEAGETEILASKLVPPNTSSTYVELTGSGTMRFDLYIDGEYYSTTEKVFTDD